MQLNGYNILFLTVEYFQTDQRKRVFQRQKKSIKQQDETRQQYFIGLGVRNSNFTDMCVLVGRDHYVKKYSNDNGK